MNYKNYYQLSLDCGFRDKHLNRFDIISAYYLATRSDKDIPTDIAGSTQEEQTTWMEALITGLNTRRNYYIKLSNFYEVLCRYTFLLIFQACILQTSKEQRVPQYYSRY